MHILPLFVPALFSSLLSELMSANRTKISVFFNFKSNLEELINTMHTIEAALYAVHKVPLEEGQFVDETLLKDLQHLVEDMDDLSESVGTASLGRTRQYTGKVGEIKDRLKSIIARMEMFKTIGDSAKKNNGGTEDSDDDYDSLARKPKEFFGREIEKGRILKFLSSDREDKFSFSICGMGGLGKTELAKLIVNDEDVQKKFEQILWVRVSRKDSKWKPIFIKILNEIQDELGTKSEKHPLQKFNKIFGDRLKVTTLVVLDDLWEMSIEDWDNVHDLLYMSGRNKVLITTRILGVVNRLDEELPLEPLSQKDSLSLFKKIVAKDTPIDETQSKKIVEKCEGLPVLVRAFALLFNRKLHVKDITSKKIWKLGQSGLVEVKGILGRLKKSYDYLDPHIKSCFVYCAVFVHPLDRERVAQMWIAQRFIRPTSEDEDELEDTANGYWDKLKSASFIRAVKMNDLHQVNKFQLAPLVRDLALFLSDKEYSEISNPNVARDSPHAPRHVSILLQEGDFQLNFDPLKQKALRTFACRGNMELPDQFVSKFRNLRVMNLNGLNFKVLPGSIKGLKHLRYVDISENKLIESLPRSIGNLHNLETLRVDNCVNMVALPEEICRLRNLRNLYICFQQPSLTNISRISSLRSLYITCQQESLDDISGIVSLRTLQLVKCTCLTSLPDMQKFTLLENLEILDCKVLKFADGMKGLKRLQSLTMVNLPELSDLPSGLDDAKDSLESLYFVGCSKLNTSPEWFASFNLLQRLTIRGCPKLSQTLESNHVEHVNNIWLDGNEYSPGSSNSPSSSSDARMTTHEQGESSNATGEDQAHGRIINFFEMALLKFYDIIIGINLYVLKFFKRGSDVE